MHRCTYCFVNSYDEDDDDDKMKMFPSCILILFLLQQLRKLQFFFEKCGIYSHTLYKMKYSILTMNNCSKSPMEDYMCTIWHTLIQMTGFVRRALMYTRRYVTIKTVYVVLSVNVQDIHVLTTMGCHGNSGS